MPDHGDLKRVLFVETTRFTPLDDRPLAGNLSVEDLPGKTVTLPAMSQVILINPKTCPDCLD